MDDWLEASYEDRTSIDTNNDGDSANWEDDEPEENPYLDGDYPDAKVHLRSGDGTACGTADMPAPSTNDEHWVTCGTCRSLL